jgi:hypothetical protein
MQVFIQEQGMRHSPRGFSVIFAGEWWEVHCFADRAEAAMFKAVFNGEWCHPEDRGAGGIWARWEPSEPVPFRPRID